MAVTFRGPRTSAMRSLLAGLATGALAALLASLTSLPLRSPDDAFFNTVSVTIGALLVGLAGGALWWAVGRRRSPFLVFILLMAVAFALVAMATVALELWPGAPLDRIIQFMIPLAAIAFAGVALLTPLLAQSVLPLTWLAPAATIAALALGVVLAGQGDAPSGTLVLPQASGQGEVLRPEAVAGVAFQVVPGESVLTYTVREKLAVLALPNDAVGRTTELSGTIYLDGRPSRIVADLRTLQSDQPRRDRYIRYQGGPVFERYPFAEFTLTDLGDLPSQYRPGETVKQNVTGLLKIREVERPWTFAVEARLQDGALYVLGTTDFTWDDFQIPPPTIANLVQVEDTVHVEVLLVARRDEGSSGGG